MQAGQVSRRSVLAAVASPAIVTLCAAATEAPDPIFAAIATAVEADEIFTALLVGLDENDDAAMHAANEASDRSSDAMAALAAVTPTTIAGLHALIQHYAEDCEQQDRYSVGAVCLHHLARCVASASRPAHK